MLKITCMHIKIFRSGNTGFWEFHFQCVYIECDIKFLHTELNYSCQIVCENMHLNLATAVKFYTELHYKRTCKDEFCLPNSFLFIRESGSVGVEQAILHTRQR